MALLTEIPPSTTPSFSILILSRPLKCGAKFWTRLSNHSPACRSPFVEEPPRWLPNGWLGKGGRCPRMVPSALWCSGSILMLPGNEPSGGESGTESGTGLRANRAYRTEISTLRVQE